MALRVASLAIVFLACSLTSCAQQPPKGASMPIMATDMTEAAREGLARHLDDWAQLRRYAAENAQLGPAQPGRVVFYGDSLTDHWGRIPGTSFFPGKPYINRGISGQTTPQMLVRFPQDVLALHPAAVILLAGTNDIAGNTGPETLAEVEANFAAMATLAEANGIRVLLASTLPMSKLPWHPNVAPAEAVRQLNTWLDSYASAHRMIYVDYYSALVNDEGGMKTELTTDGYVHPNAAGYAVMTPIAEKAIAAAMKRPAPKANF